MPAPHSHLRPERPLPHRSTLALVVRRWLPFHPHVRRPIEHRDRVRSAADVNPGDGPPEVRGGVRNGGDRAAGRGDKGAEAAGGEEGADGIWMKRMLDSVVEMDAGGVEKDATACERRMLDRCVCIAQRSKAAAG